MEKVIRHLNAARSYYKFGVYHEPQDDLNCAVHAINHLLQEHLVISDKEYLRKIIETKTGNKLNMHWFCLDKTIEEFMFVFESADDFKDISMLDDKEWKTEEERLEDLNVKTEIMYNLYKKYDKKTKEWAHDRFNYLEIKKGPKHAEEQRNRAKCTSQGMYGIPVVRGVLDELQLDHQQYTEAGNVDYDILLSNLKMENCVGVLLQITHPVHWVAITRGAREYMGNGKDCWLYIDSIGEDGPTEHELEHGFLEEQLKNIWKDGSRSRYCGGAFSVFYRDDTPNYEAIRAMKGLPSTSANAVVTVPTNKRKDSHVTNTPNRPMKYHKASTSGTKVKTEDKSLRYIHTLPELDHDIVGNALNAKDNSDLETVISACYGLKITKDNIQCLRSVKNKGYKGWLNSEVISFYMEILQDKCTLSSKSALKCHIMGSFFYEKLSPLVDKKKETHAYDYEGVQHWYREARLRKRHGCTKANIMSFDKLLFPINHSKEHWVLAEIDMQNGIIRYYDSLKSDEKSEKRYAQVVKDLIRWLKDEEKHNDEAKHMKFPSTDFVAVNVKDCPQQDNGIDCGVFVCMCALHLINDKQLNFDQNDVNLFRKRMVHDIVRASCEKKEDEKIDEDDLLLERITRISKLESDKQRMKTIMNRLRDILKADSHMDPAQSQKFHHQLGLLRTKYASIKKEIEGLSDDATEIIALD